MLLFYKFLLFVLSIVMVSEAAHLSDAVNEFSFNKTQDGSDEYDFWYALDNGTDFIGKTFNLNDPHAHIYVMFGADGQPYWVKFTQDEYDNGNSFTKIVRIVDRSEDAAIFKDDYVQYEITISTAFMFVTPYKTNWDLDNICFMHSVTANQTLQYFATATNNSRKFNGTTYLESDDEHVQLIHLKDGNQRDDVYEIRFTDEDLKMSGIFCKGIFEVISAGGILGAYPVSNINPSLLKSLAG